MIFFRLWMHRQNFFSPIDVGLLTFYLSVHSHTFFWPHETTPVKDDRVKNCRFKL